MTGGIYAIAILNGALYRSGHIDLTVAFIVLGCLVSDIWKKRTA